MSVIILYILGFLILETLAYIQLRINHGTNEWVQFFTIYQLHPIIGLSWMSVAMRVAKFI